MCVYDAFSYVANYCIDLELCVLAILFIYHKSGPDKKRVRCAAAIMLQTLALDIKDITINGMASDGLQSAHFENDNCPE